METVLDIDAEIERLQRLRLDLAAAEAERRQQENQKEAYELMGKLVQTLERLHELGFVPPVLAKALTNAEGNFRPGMYIKRPRIHGSDTDEAQKPQSAPSGAKRGRPRKVAVEDMSAEPSPTTQEEEQ